MIYITQFIFVKEGKEDVFLEFEDHAIPLIERYNGKVNYRLRPEQGNFIGPFDRLPYEIHFITFASEHDFQAFMQDKSRLAFMHLKEESVESTILVKGSAL